jgi:hypothetical protein
VRITLQALLNQTRKARESAAHIRMAGRKPHPHIARYGNHRRSSTSRTRASASGSTCASTRMRLRLPRSISINPFRAAGNCRIRLSSSDGDFEFSSPVSTAAAICTGAKHGPTRSAVRACRRQVNTRLAATPLRRATSVHLHPRRQRLLDDPRLVILRPAPPPLQPAQNLDPHRLMTLKLDLRSHASRNTTRQTRRRSSDAYAFSEGKTPLQIMAMGHRSSVRLDIGFEVSAFVKGFGCRPLEGWRRVFGGRRPKASKGGNRA